MHIKVFAITRCFIHMFKELTRKIAEGIQLNGHKRLDFRGSII